MIRLKYKDFTFYDVEIYEGNCLLTNSMISDKLESDILTFNVTDQVQSFAEFLTSQNEPFITADNQVFSVTLHDEPLDLRHYIYGEPIYLYTDDTLIAKMYLKSIRQRGQHKYQLEAVSTVGLLIRMQHNGGIYTGETTGKIIADIMGNLEYTIDSDVASIPVYGHLPIASRRDNLQQVLFVAGASVLKSADGILHFTFNQPDNAKELPNNRLYIGGDRDYVAPATKVYVTEHSFYASDSVKETVLYDNSRDIVATNQKIVFSKPVHSLRATDSQGNPGGITVHESNANYAIISGIGILYGKEYVHAKRTLSKSMTFPNAEEKEVSVSNATLVSALNSNNMLERVANFYGYAGSVTYDLLLGDERPGDLVLFQDPFGEQAQGYIKDMDINVSHVTKARVEITTGWKPIALGNNFTKFKVIQKSDVINGKWTTPADMIGKSALAVLFGGATGGDGGTDGKPGGKTGWRENAFFIEEWQQFFSGYPYVDGGEGGLGGKGGACGRYLTFPIPSLEASYNADIGTGGEGGKANGTEETIKGKAGTDTTFGDKTTASGIVFVGNYVNLINGEIYAKSGLDGYNGGHGGCAGGKGKYIPIAKYSIRFLPGSEGLGQDGGNGGDSKEYKGGKGAEFTESTSYEEGDRVWYDAEYAGSGGGGAAYGKPGESAIKGTTSNGRGITPSKPGAGTTAETPSKGAFGKGGQGGHGGGGGGAVAGGMQERNSENTGQSFKNLPNNFKSIPGKGTDGADGGDGFVIIYY